ncbi:MAG: glycosyltransferase family 39 protein [Dysgonamonadaceae bacterium]|jgi:uncharacterized membrane protein|nr:glycosyltransferase family 39 protein [Dysgonamonadaceae bacterium]
MMKRIIDNRKSFYSLIEAGLIVMFAAELIFLATFRSIWFDEAFSLAIVRHSVQDIISLTAADVHPPLYYFILKIAFSLFGESICVAKLVSVLPSVLTLIFSTCFLKKHFSDKAAILFLLCFIASNNMVYYSIEIRMYSWALFFVTMTAIAVWHIISDGKTIWWIMFLLSAVCAAYTHYYAGLTVGIEYILLLYYIIRHDRKKVFHVFSVAILALLLYLPWIATVISQFADVSENFWEGPLSIRKILFTFFRIFSVGSFLEQNSLTVKITTRLFSLLFCTVFLFYFFRKNKDHRDFFAFSGLSSMMMTAFIGISLSFIIHPMFIFRYLVPASGLVWFFVAIEGSYIKSKKFVTVFCFVLLSFGVITYTTVLFSKQKSNDDFNTLHSFFSSKIKPDDVFEYDGQKRNFNAFLISYLFTEHPVIEGTLETFHYQLVYNKVFKIKYVSNSLLSDSCKQKNVRILKFIREPYENALKDDDIEFCGSFKYESEVGIVKYNVFAKSIK